MPYKLLTILLLSILLVACGPAKKRANLSTDNPGTTDYLMYFNGKLVSSSDKTELPVKVRFKLFRNILNGFLHKDENTKQCSVVIGTINLSPLGPGGSVRVRCIKSVPIEIDSTSFTAEGKPFFRYWVNGREGI